MNSEVELTYSHPGELQECENHCLRYGVKGGGYYSCGTWEDCCPVCHLFQRSHLQQIAAGWDELGLQPALTGHDRCGTPS